MSQMDIEYAIKKDVRNNPIVREVDMQQKREFARTLGVTVLVVGMLLFSVWQHVGVLRHGYEIEQLQKERAAEEVLNRKLRLELEALLAPSRIERLATTDLHMVAPSPKDSIVIERVGSAAQVVHAVVIARAR
jgi:cell division protein FtsL